MLRGIKNATSNWLGRVIMGILLGLIAISFAIWGVGDIFRGFGQSTVAKVGNTEIRIEQFRQTYLDQLQQFGRRLGRPITQEQARALGLDRQVLSQVLAETVLDERARSLGLELSNAEIARRITEDPSFRGLTGQFDRARFDMLIRQAGFTEARFMAEQRRNALRQQLVGSVNADPVVPGAAAELIFRYQNEQRSIEYVKLGPAQAGEVPAPSPEELAKYFEERKVVFRAPEYRKVDILSATAADLASSYEISDADLRKAYEARKDRYATPERRKLSQIVFPSAQEAAAAAEKIAKGEAFSAIAAARDLKDSDTDLGTVARTEMVDRAVADAAFALKEGETSQPVQGRFGTVLVRVDKVEPGHTPTFEEAADRIRKEMQQERARLEMANVHDKIEDERLTGASLDGVAKKLGLKIQSIEAMDRSGRTPDGRQVTLPQGIDVLTPVFGAEMGPDNEPINVQGGGYVWYEVREITRSRDRPLEEVREQVEARWRDEEIARRLKAKADEMLGKLKAGETIAAVAAAAGAKSEWLPGLRRGATGQALPARAIEEVFRTPKDGAGTADGASPTERFVFRVNDITVPAFAADSADAKRIDETLRRAISEEILAQYLARLEKDVGVTINQAALNQVTGAAAN